MSTFTFYRPRFGSIAAAVAYSGKCRSILYENAARHPNLFRKDGRSTRVDFDVLDELLNKLPAAKLKAPADRRGA